MLQLTEHETKWDVDPDFVLPDLTGVVAGGNVEYDTVDTVSSYYDTDDADLRVHGIVLRRRDGDDDTGWQLSLPGGETDDLHWPLSDVPPAEVAALLAGVTGGRQLHNIGTIHTVRHRQRINATNSDDPIAEIAEDEVRASTGERLLAWREVGVGVDPAATRQTKELRRLLKKAGAKPTRYASKLAHLAGTAPKPPAALSPAAWAMTSYLNAQIDAVIAGDIALRRGRDPIHDTRVALRRLRSTLRVFTPLLQADAVGDLENELKWFAGLLGEVRDCQVQQRRFTEAVDELPDVLVLGPVRARIRSDLRAIELPARNEVTTAMDSPRYLDLIARLRAWRIVPPLQADLTEKRLRTRVHKAGRKADGRLAEALDAQPGERGALLHRARKAAKRARYAAELQAELPKATDSRRTIKRYKEIQSVLGDHQDTVVARDMLRRIGAAAGSTAGENGFTFGMLYAREEQIAQRCSREVERL
jgi:CHAD domain-containing protein